MKKTVWIVLAVVALAAVVAVSAGRPPRIWRRIRSEPSGPAAGRGDQGRMGQPARLDSPGREGSDRRGREEDLGARGMGGRRRHAEHAAAPRHQPRFAEGGHRDRRRRLSDARPLAARANGRNITFADGRKLFMGSSGTGAPKDGADPTEPPR